MRNSKWFFGWLKNKLCYVQQLLCCFLIEKFWEYFLLLLCQSQSKLADEKQGCLPGPQKLNWTLLWQKWMGFWNSWQVTQPLVWPHWCTMLVFFNFQYTPIYGELLTESNWCIMYERYLLKDCKHLPYSCHHCLLFVFQSTFLKNNAFMLSCFQHLIF